MKIKGLLIGMLACTALVGCTNEDVIDNPNENPVVKGDKAYVVVSIKNANGTSSRGAAGSPEFSDGIAAENEVNSATFFFYDAQGKYVTKSAPSTTFNNKPEANDNVEKIAESVVVLEGLNGKNYPNYVVAVLNCPTAIVNKLHTQQIPLSQVKKELVGATESPYLNDGKFIMSNSTYDNSDATSQYFATKVTNDNFLVERPNEEKMSSTNVVDIYVERLAVKANLTLATAASNKIALTKYDVNGEDATLYVEVLNWKLNGTNKDSYLMKNVDETFTAYDADVTDTNIKAFDWNAKANFRSYWGKSYNWGVGTYPAGFTPGTTVADGLTLNYFSWDAMDENPTGTAQYCAENTNSGASLNDGNFHSIVTEALLQAQIYTLAGEEYVPTELIRYNNTLYTKDVYVKQALLNLGKTWWTIADDPETTDKVEYRSLADTDVQYVNKGNGIGVLELTTTASGLAWYATAPTTDPATETAAEVTAINTDLGSDIVKAEIYKDGMMYYNIPIEHLRGGKFEYVDGTNKPSTGDSSSDTEVEDIKVNEADYGVVRNHYYNITVNKIENLGNAVLDPDEIIIPIDKNNTTYYVGANISILAWKVVNQNVDL